MNCLPAYSANSLVLKARRTPSFVFEYEEAVAEGYAVAEFTPQNSKSPVMREKVIVSWKPCRPSMYIRGASIST